MKRQGFTIVELMLVIAVIGILAGIVTAAAIGALKSARSRQAETSRVALEQGIHAYYAQENEWPAAIEAMASGSTTVETEMLSYNDCDKVFREVVGKGFGQGGGRQSPLLDAAGIYVCNAANVKNSGRGCYDNHRNREARNTYCGDCGCLGGVTFEYATAPNSDYKIPLSQMAFGYRGTVEGRFCRFWIKYNGKADSVSVVSRGPDL